MASEPLYTVRKPTSADTPFIFSGWLESYANSSPLTVNIPKTLFFDGHRALITPLLSNAQVVVACLPDDPGVLLGFACGEPVDGLLHYVYVKAAFRRMGVATRLVDALGIKVGACSCTHWTYDLSRLKQKLSGLQFNPYLLGA